MHIFRHGPRILCGLFRQPDDGIDGGLHLLVAEHHRAQHHLFAEFLGFGFHHHHRVSGARDDEIELGFRIGVDARIKDIFAVDITDAGRADRAHEGNAGNGERSRRRHHGHDIGIIFQVVGQNLRHHQSLILDSLRQIAAGWDGRSGARSGFRVRLARAHA